MCTSVCVSVCVCVAMSNAFVYVYTCVCERVHLPVSVYTFLVQFLRVCVNSSPSLEVN